MSIAPPPPAGVERDPRLLLATLEGLARRLSLESLDELWIFPPRRHGEIESVVVVATAFVQDDADRRRILTAHLTARRSDLRKTRRKVAAKPIEPMVVEQGEAPADRIGRVVEGVMRRLDEELAALPPRQVRIGGEVARWEELIAEIGAGVA